MSLKLNFSHANLSYYVCSIIKCFLFAGILNLRYTIPGHTFLQTIHVFGSYEINFCYLAGIILYISNTKKQPPEVFHKKGVLKNFPIFTGKHLCWRLFLIKLQTFFRCWRLFLIKLQTFSSATLLKRDSNISVFLWILRNL